MTAYSTYKMTDTRADLGFEEGTTGEAASTHTVHDVPEGTGVAPEILKSPRMPRPKKDKQAMGPVRMSPRNPWFGKLSMEENGKVVTTETDEEEEDLQALIAKVEEEEDVEADIQPMHYIAKLPEYVPLRKGKVKV